MKEVNIMNPTAILFWLVSAASAAAIGTYSWVYGNFEFTFAHLSLSVSLFLGMGLFQRLGRAFRLAAGGEERQPGSLDDSRKVVFLASWLIGALALVGVLIGLLPLALNRPAPDPLPQGLLAAICAVWAGLSWAVLAPVGRKLDARLAAGGQTS